MGHGDDDTSAFDRLIVEHLPGALRFAIRLTGDVHLAEDVVQDALLRAIKARQSFGRRFRGESKFTTWLFRIVINAFRDRASSMRPTDRLSESIDREVEDRSTDPVKDADANELGAIVAGHVSNLPARQREVLVLIAYEQIPPAEVATILGISEQNVRTTLHLARERMRMKLAAYMTEKSRER